jgi:FkbM family methyltransferase
MNLEAMATKFLPPPLAWRVTRKAREQREAREFGRFYGAFLAAGDLCFDIGANLGNRTRSFRRLGCTVVAVEPQGRCFARLEREFAADAQVKLVKCAVGREPGEAVLHVSRQHVLSSLSPAFMTRTVESGRFAGVAWQATERVVVTTLDQLIADHGEPRFIKIDVEGFEAEVLAGLSRPVAALSIEWTPELSENTRVCLRRLAELGDYEFNLSWGESMRFSRPEWRSLQSMLAVIDEFDGETLLFGDVYARVRKTPGK